jgi:nitrous oxide reductase accessory protein NosL
MGGLPERSSFEGIHLLSVSEGETMEWRFDESETWTFSDLTEEEREYAEAEGCEVDKVYFGEPLHDNEVPQCPVCGCIVWNGERCKHLVFVHDMNSGFEFVDPIFFEVFWRHFYPERRREIDAVYGEDVEEMQKQKQLPIPDDLEFVDGLQFYASYSHFGDRGIVCGFLEDGYLDPKS